MGSCSSRQQFARSNPHGRAGLLSQAPRTFSLRLRTAAGLISSPQCRIRNAQGRIIAFLDDDVIAEPTWLQNLTASLRDGRWAGAGGRILPTMDFEPPHWLTLGGEMDLGGTLALFDLGEVSCELKRAPFGTNMAFRKNMFEKYGIFRVDLGRCGNILLSEKRNLATASCLPVSTWGTTISSGLPPCFEGTPQQEILSHLVV